MKTTYLYTLSVEIAMPSPPRPTLYLSDIGRDEGKNANGRHEYTRFSISPEDALVMTAEQARECQDDMGALYGVPCFLTLVGRTETPD